MIAVVSALPEEARALLRRLRRRRLLPLVRGRATIGHLGNQEIALAVTGDGAEQARAGLEALLAAVPAVGVIGIGFCGALTEGLHIDSLVVARRIDGEGSLQPLPHAPWIERAGAVAGATDGTILTVAALLLTAEQKAEARQHLLPGPAVADLESAPWASTAARAGLPFLILRVVSDTAQEELPPVLARSLRPDGSVDRLRVLRNAVSQPASLPVLLRLASRARRGSRHLADALHAMANARPSLEDTASSSH